METIKYLTTAKICTSLRSSCAPIRLNCSTQLTFFPQDGERTESCDRAMKSPIWIKKFPVNQQEWLNWPYESIDLFWRIYLTLSSDLFSGSGCWRDRLNNSMFWSVQEEPYVSQRWINFFLLRNGLHGCCCTRIRLRPHRRSGRNIGRNGYGRSSGPSSVVHCLCHQGRSPFSILK